MNIEFLGAQHNLTPSFGATGAREWLRKTIKNRRRDNRSKRGPLHL